MGCNPSRHDETGSKLSTSRKSTGRFEQTESGGASKPFSYLAHGLDQAAHRLKLGSSDTACLGVTSREPLKSMVGIDCLVAILRLRPSFNRKLNGGQSNTASWK